MALFDKLKDVAGKAKEVAAKAAAAASEYAEQAKEKEAQRRQAAQEAEAARKEAEAKAAEEKKIAKINELKENMIEYRDRNYGLYASYNSDLRKLVTEEEADAIEEDIERIIEERAAVKSAEFKEFLKTLSDTTNCDQGQGDCFWQGKIFYCSCAADFDCPRKKYVKKDQIGQIHTEEHIPYLKYLSQFEKKQYLTDETQYYYSNKGSGEIGYYKAVRELFREFLPEQVGNDTEYACDFFYEHGFGDENPVMKILYFIHDQRGSEIKLWLADLIQLYNNGVDMTQSFFYNISLYERNTRDFRYTVSVLDAANDPLKALETFAHPEKVDINALFNADGTIKATGYGGPKEGFYGDEIYNIVTTWNEEE